MAKKGRSGVQVRNISVTVKLFGTLRKYAPGYDREKGLPITLAKGDTVQKLLKILGIPEDEARISLVKGVFKKLADPLNDGDEISLFLPIAGG